MSKQLPAKVVLVTVSDSTLNFDFTAEKIHGERAVFSVGIKKSCYIIHISFTN